MRPVKYRAWDKKNKQWIQFSLPHGTTSLECIVGPDAELSEWLEYTGLQDKDGKEIWEGDVLTEEDGGVGEVKMIQGCWCMDYLYKQPHPILYPRIVKVIGNIYEYPELLHGSD